MTPLIQLYTYLRIFVDLCINFLFGLYFDRKRQQIPAAKNQLILESAGSLAAQIRDKKVKVEDVVEAFIERIGQVNRVVNAVVDTRFDEALSEARQIDVDIRSGKFNEEDFKKKPLLGVPFTTKESTSSKGLKWTLGLMCRRDVRATADAKVVELMKNAGAILIGVTNVPELNMWPETYNPVYGTSKNPFNTTKNVGGSSGGEGCIIAAGGCPLGIGSDLGGSIRIPSFRCGIFGHKCSPDLISNQGLCYMTGNEGQTMVVAGPMAKYADDLVLVLKVLLGNKVSKLRLDEKVDAKKLNVYYMTSTECLWASPVSKEMKDVLFKVVNYFSETLEVKPKRVRFHNARYAMKLWSYMLKQEEDDYSSDLTNHQGTVCLSTELFKYLRGGSQYTLYTLFNLSNGLIINSPSRWARQTLTELKREILDTLGDNGVLLCSSEPFPASYHYASLLRPYNLSHYALWSALKMPVTQVPLGLNSAGLPVGIQVVAGPCQDRLCLAVAKELEKAFGGYVAPFEVEMQEV